MVLPIAAIVGIAAAGAQIASQQAAQQQAAARQRAMMQALNSTGGQQSSYAIVQSAGKRPKQPDILGELIDKQINSALLEVL